jgi:Uma2 family endonuclease
MTVAIPIQQLSFEEYLAYDDGTDTRYELVNGQLEPMNPPTFRHLFIAKFLEQNLDSEITRLTLALPSGSGRANRLAKISTYGYLCAENRASDWNARSVCRV